jgi:hypothetical protein
MEERDRFLTDFRAAWAGLKDQDGSVLDGELPQAYIDAFHRINGPESNYSGQKKHVKDLSASIGSVSVTASDVGLIMMQAAATIRMDDPDQVRRLGQTLIAAADQMNAASAPVVGANGQVLSDNRPYSQNSKLAYGNPILKEQMERNLRELEKFAEQSAYSYPKYT